MRQEKPALPTQQDSSYSPHHWSPPPSSQLGNSLDFPEGQPPRTGSDLPTQRPCHTPSTALASAPLIIYSQGAACSPPGSPS